MLVTLILAASDGAVAGTPGTMTPVSDDRSIAAFGEPLGDSGESCDAYESFGEMPSPAFAFFDDMVSGGDGGYGSQTSSVGTDALGGSGYASGYSELCYGIGNSTYDISFTLSGTAQLHLSGDIDAFDTIGFGYAETTARLTRDGQVLYEEITDPFTGFVSLSYLEVVPPGSYRLALEADGDVGIDSSWNFTLDADPVVPPVPALGAQGLVGLIGLLALSGGVVLRRIR